jgi:hypothetical protein
MKSDIEYSDKGNGNSPLVAFAELVEIVGHRGIGESSRLEKSVLLTA